MADEEKDPLLELAERAEEEVNTYQAKTGRARGNDLGEAGVDTRVEKKFPGAQVAYEPDIRINKNVAKKLAEEEEGGNRDEDEDRDRHHRHESPDEPVDVVEDLLPEEAVLPEVVQKEPDVAEVLQGIMGVQERGLKPHYGKDPLDQGILAAEANLAKLPPKLVRANHQFKGEDYYYPEDVPDSISDQGLIPPESIIHASRHT